MEWVKHFYQHQFELAESDMEQMPASYFEEEAAKIEEQYGKPFENVLELGAGNGQLANAVAKRGKEVTTIELSESLTRFAQKHLTERVNILCGDFYKIELSRVFDCVLYIDGFGIGEDEDQVHLLRRIRNWLKDDGYALIDIYEPNYWRNVWKKPMKPTQNEFILRQYDFDEKTNRMIDTWWHAEAEGNASSQSLKCYHVNEIEALCKLANLDIVAYYPGGAVDYDTWTFHEPASLNHCISYRIKVKKK